MRPLAIVQAVGVIAGLLYAPFAFAAGGRVLDDANAPVRDAWVVAWRIDCAGLVRCRTMCVEVKVTKTRSDGRYAFNSGLRSAAQYNMYVYREIGPADPDPNRGRRQKDKRFADLDPVTARVAHLAASARSMSCATAPLAERAALLPVFQAMFREAETVARFPEHRRMAREICDAMLWTQVRMDAPSPSLEEQSAQERRFFASVEPACNAKVERGGDDAILSALGRGDAAAVRSTTGFDFNRLLDGHNLPIITAVTKGDAAMVSALAFAGAKPDAMGPQGTTGLTEALSGHVQGPTANRTAVIKALLAAGADANRPNTRGEPPLVQAAKAPPSQQDAEALEALLQHGANANGAIRCSDHCSGEGWTALHYLRDDALARLVIAKGANVNAASRSGDTPLMRARSPALIRLLLQSGAAPNATNSGGWTPLMYAVQDYERSLAGGAAPHRSEAIEVLVQAGARLDAKNSHGLGALDYTNDAAMKQRMRELAAQGK